MEFFLALSGAFFGAGFAFLGDFILRRRGAIEAEQAAVNSLLFDLEEKRALTIDREAAWSPQAAKNITSSILDAKIILREARRSLRPGSAFLEPLQKMTRACNTFLEATEYREFGPTHSDATQLSQALRGHATALRRAGQRKSIPNIPGAVTYDREIDRKAQ